MSQKLPLKQSKDAREPTSLELNLELIEVNLRKIASILDSKISIVQQNYNSANLSPSFFESLSQTNEQLEDSLESILKVCASNMTEAQLSQSSQSHNSQDMSQNVQDYRFDQGIGYSQERGYDPADQYPVQRGYEDGLEEGQQFIQEQQFQQQQQFIPNNYPSSYPSSYPSGDDYEEQEYQNEEQQYGQPYGEELYGYEGQENVNMMEDQLYPNNDYGQGQYQIYEGYGQQPQEETYEAYGFDSQGAINNQQQAPQNPQKKKTYKKKQSEPAQARSAEDMEKQLNILAMFEKEQGIQVPKFFKCSFFMQKNRKQRYFQYLRNADFLGVAKIYERLGNQQKVAELLDTTPNNVKKILAYIQNNLQSLLVASGDS